jgi:Fe-S cluster biogenesis protein NfuA
MAAEKEFRQRMQRLDALVKEVERFADPAARAYAREIIQALLHVHGTGIDRMLEHVAATGELGVALIESMARDEIVSGLLLLHGLHPANLETRVRQALDKVRPYLRSHGGNVELLGVNGDGVVRLSMQGSCHGCPSSAITLKTAIEEAIYEQAPDVTGIEVDAPADGATVADVRADGFVPVEQLFNRQAAKAAVL